MTRFTQIVYKRPDLHQIATDFVKMLDEFDKAENLEKQSNLLAGINELKNEFQTYASIASVRNTIDTSNSFYEEEQKYYDENGPVFEDLNIRYYKSLGNSKFKADLKGKFGHQLFDLAEVSLKSFDSKIIDDLKEENRLTTEYVKIVASAVIEFEGKVTNLAGLDPFEQSTDRAMRKKAYEAKWGFFAKHREEFDDIYDKLVKLRHNMALKLGYQNFVQLGYNRMSRTEYTPADIASFRDKILKHIAPVANDLRLRQQKRIGVESMMMYDMGFHYPNGNPVPKGTPEWIIENGRKMYSELSAETREFFDFMVEFELMDLVNKQNKAAGGYCTYFSKYKSPFIFSNFNGTSHDIDVLTHEAGHAFQGYQSRMFEIGEYSFPTYEACEIHSMSMEFFTWPWMELFFKEDTQKYKFSHLSGGLLFLPYGAQVDEFQHIVYENPHFSPAERNKVWRELDGKYRPWMSYDGLSYLEQGGAWQRQGHIYKSPFYYIDYCLAQICAFQFWVRSQNDFKSAWADYLTLCKAGGSKPFLELVKVAGLQSPFEENTIQKAVGTICQWLNNVDDSKL